MLMTRADLAFDARQPATPILCIDLSMDRSSHSVIQSIDLVPSAKCSDRPVTTDGTGTAGQTHVVRLDEHWTHTLQNTVIIYFTTDDAADRMHAPNYRPS